MSEPYYSDDLVTLYHGDCREVTAWLEADVLVTDPPYGQAFKSGWTGSHIANDETTQARDEMLALWDGPRVVFGARDLPPLPGARLIWHKPGAGMGDLAVPWQPDYEFIYVAGRGFSGPRDSSVLTFPLRVFRGDSEHPHQKPVDLLERLILKCPPGIIADPFAGSGSTLVAAKQIGRRAIGVELDERYCEIAARRLAQDTLFGGVA